MTVIDRQLQGQMAASDATFRAPEPYKSNMQGQVWGLISDIRAFTTSMSVPLVRDRSCCKGCSFFRAAGDHMRRPLPQSVQSQRANFRRPEAYE